MQLKNFILQKSLAKFISLKMWQTRKNYPIPLKQIHLKLSCLKNISYIFIFEVFILE